MRLGRDSDPLSMGYFGVVAVGIGTWILGKTLVLHQSWFSSFPLACLLAKALTSFGLLVPITSNYVFCVSERLQSDKARYLLGGRRLRSVVGPI